jgi:hypothetical protein
MTVSFFYFTLFSQNNFSSRFHPVHEEGNQSTSNQGCFTEVKKPFQYFSRYLDTTFFENVAMYTNRRHVVETRKSLGTNALEISKFWGCSIVAALLGFPRICVLGRKNMLSGDC